MHRGRFVSLLALLSLPLLPLHVPIAGQGGGSPPPAYEEINVRDGGSVAGVVRTTEPAGRPKLHKVFKDHDTCGREVPDESLMRDASGALRNAVVSIEGIRRGKPIDREGRPRLHTYGCGFRPHVLAVAVGQKIEIVNSDPILHSAHAKMDGRSTLFKIALPVQNDKVAKTIERPGMISLQCDAGHPWASGYIAAFEHPYFAVTDAEGRFRIDRIPPGAYLLRAWHEKLGEQSIPVEIEAGEEAPVTFEKLSESPS